LPLYDFGITREDCADVCATGCATDCDEGRHGTIDILPCEACPAGWSCPDGSAHPVWIRGAAFTDVLLRVAIADWKDDAAASEASYGHISGWDTSNATDFSYLFAGARDWSDDSCRPEDHEASAADDLHSM